MSVEQIVMLAACAAALLGGLAVILFRDRAAQRNRDNIEAKLGKWFPGLANASTPARMIPVGVATMLIGVVVIVQAVSR